jgi:phosphoglycolate phosphatase
MLYLFDIDGTLVDTGGAGMAALKQAIQATFGTVGPPLDLAGSTDLSLISKIHDHFQIESTPMNRFEFFECYHKNLTWQLTHGGFPGRVYSGVFALLDNLSSRPQATLGLLTGNTAGGAERKIQHFGLGSYFSFGAYGCDHADRNRLGPIALKRAETHAGRNFSAAETWVIGDTPKDIACAHAIDAKCLAVATGSFSAADLEAYGADRVVESLDQAMALL